ncbi:hypothetical protein LJ754_03820 [Arthrobacter sp. zg-Y40]|uniref:hypothetical protein n=1 Tax=Arthrobacter sp. zg-Y40 TaxID=2886939 RepID=UPI001D149F50|nr:hypothetical protein [Arthrobacter sp. zg-Y40]MCC3278286.1 hypothetical protein [Arthrobacter sp. zg-Y40]
MKNLPLSLALAASSGLFTLQRPADWSPGMRRTFVLVPGAALGVLSVLAVRAGAQSGREPAGGGTGNPVPPVAAGDQETGGAAAPAPGAGPGPRMRLVGPAVIAATVGATASGVLALTMVLDQRVEAWLVRRGVARPRRVMAAASALSSLLLDQVMDAKDLKGRGDSAAGQ